MRFLTLYSGIDKGRREIVVRPEVSARHMIIVSPIAIVLLTNWEKKTILQDEKASRETYRSLLPFPSLPSVKWAIRNSTALIVFPY